MDAAKGILAGIIIGTIISIWLTLVVTLAEVREIKNTLAVIAKQTETAR